MFDPDDDRDQVFKGDPLRDKAEHLKGFLKGWEYPRRVWVFIFIQ